MRLTLILLLLFLFLSSLYPNQQILHSQEVHQKLAAMMSEEVERQVNERLQQVRDDTTILKDQLSDRLKQVREDTTILKDRLSRETSFMSTFVSGGIQRIEDRVRLISSLPPSPPSFSLPA